MRCDKIFVMEQGKFIEQGTHNQLIQKKGRYYNLWKDQLPDNIEAIPDNKIQPEEPTQTICPGYPIFMNPMM